MSGDETFHLTRPMRPALFDGLLFHLSLPLRVARELRDSAGAAASADGWLATPEEFAARVHDLVASLDA